MAQIYSFTLMNAMLEDIEDFCIEDSDDIDGAVRKAADYMQKHSLGYATLEMDDQVTYRMERNSIDISIEDDGTIKAYDYQTAKETIL